MIGTLFVENNGALVGYFKKGFLKIAIGEPIYTKVPVGVIMTRMPNIICGFAEDRAYDLAKK